MASRTYTKKTCVLKKIKFCAQIMITILGLIISIIRGIYI